MNRPLLLLPVILLVLFAGSDERSHPAAFTFDNPKINESSGIIASRTYPGVLWTHNDSGGKPRNYPVFLDPEKAKRYGKRSVKIKKSRNVDWEEIAAYGKGQLVIGDFGNNANDRKDLVLYIIDEPDPYNDTKAVVRRSIPFSFEDQDAFPPANRNFDCEAMFVRGERVYLLTKHRSDTKTTLYKLVGNRAVRLSDFEIGGKVTAADRSTDGRWTAVLTYDDLWLFEGEGEDPFTGKATRIPIRLGQCEAVCFEGGNVVVTNEEGEVFLFPLERLTARKTPLR